MVGEVDPNGNYTASSEYDVYGNVRATTGTRTTSHGFVGSLGHFSDSATNLIYMRARYYDPGIGRFVRQDPKGSGGNWYVYCDDGPTVEVDATGKMGGAIGQETVSWIADIFAQNGLDEYFGSKSGALLGQPYASSSKRMIPVQYHPRPSTKSRNRSAWSISQ